MDTKIVLYNDNLGYTPKLDITKRANKKSVKVGDSFRYTINVTNSGDTEIIDIILTDILSDAFLLENIIIDGKEVQGDITTGLNIGDLSPGDNICILLTVRAILSYESTFNNEIVINAKAIINPNKEVISITATRIDIIGVRVYNPSLVLEKRCNTEYSVARECVIYTIIATNNGDVNLENVIISDILSAELEFIEGTIKIDGIKRPNEVITSGVNIGDINIGSTTNITFKAKVLSNKLPQIVNQSTADYEFLLPETFRQSGSSISNKTIVNTEKAEVKIIKTANKKSASLNDEIVYSVKLINEGTLDALNVILIDKLPIALQIINGTFKIDGKIINGVNLSKGVNIGEIAVGVTVAIEYTAKVVSGNCSGMLINEAQVRFKYILPDETILSTESILDDDSNTLITLNISNFKQISVDEYLRIPEQKPDMESINNIMAKVDIICSHLVRTPKDSSNENQKLSGYKLIVHGVLDQVVEYTALVDDQKVHSASYKVPFSTFIILPESFKPGSKIEIEGVVEDIYYKMNDCRTFFKTVTLLMIAKILECSN